ncbi:MAG: DUF4956 domain-containing protein [Planctomycetes bacterium]|nr:DUF4956 domain-containing protein [Planctomycetota bacterium]
MNLLPDSLEQLFAGALPQPGDPSSSVARSIALRLAAAALAGGFVAGVHRLARRGHGRASLTTTLVLLTLLVALTAVIIGNSVARAFGLVGALSIVRFRTVVEDSRDTAFVIFAVVAGMALGSGEWIAAAVGVPLAGLVALLLTRAIDARTLPPLLRLVVRVAPGKEPEALLKPLLDQRTHRRALVAAGSAKQGAALEMRYDVELREPDALLPMVVQLLAIEGVLHAEFEERET